MVTINEDEIEPTPKAAQAEGLFREVVAGNKRGAVRRIILWVLVIALVASDAPTWMALLPIALLFGTDDLL